VSVGRILDASFHTIDGATRRGNTIAASFAQSTQMPTLACATFHEVGSLDASCAALDRPQSAAGASTRPDHASFLTHLRFAVHEYASINYYQSMNDMDIIVTASNH
jgi:hypothetical protein